MEMSWYALRVPFGRELKLKAVLDNMGVDSFIPMSRRVVTNNDGTKSHVDEPAIKNLIFAYSSFTTLRSMGSHSGCYVPFFFMLDRTTNQNLVVPIKQMEQFMAVSKTMHDDLMYLPQEDLKIKTGDYVKVTEGVFQGVEGHVVRIKRDRRVLVKIDNVVSVATAYVSPTILEKIDCN